MEQAVRDEFEAAYPLPDGMERNGESYTGGEMWWLWEERWQVWQRSRAALRVVLPDDGIEDCQRPSRTHQVTQPGATSSP